MLCFVLPIKANLEKSGDVPAQEDSYENIARNPDCVAGAEIARARGAKPQT